ncbi:unnamed protein product [Prunus armeniaca]|uniref:Uncharacterized protein n=1 Tax=Prunus armeniaca TaxID=36596 RepID=A0A6J5X079_PRUAR|nr:unnamed protein product [Prunus armeniaca]
MPAMQLPAIGGVGQLRTVEEWSEAVRCFRKARKSWLLDFLQVSQEDLQQRDGQLIEVLKKVQTKAKLVRIGSIPLTELGRLKAWILNTESNGLLDATVLNRIGVAVTGMWDALVDVVAALQHADGSVKRQWLVDAVEISCVSSHPSTLEQIHAYSDSGPTYCAERFTSHPFLSPLRL